MVEIVKKAGTNNTATGLSAGSVAFDQYIFSTESKPSSELNRAKNIIEKFADQYDLTAKQKEQLTSITSKLNPDALQKLDLFLNRLGTLSSPEITAAISNIYQIITAKNLDQKMGNITGADLASDLILRLSKKFQDRQNDTNLCTVAGVNGMLADEHMSTLIRMNRDVAIDGKTTLLDGSTMYAYDMRNHIEKNSSKVPARLLPDQVIQNSLMAHQVSLVGLIYDSVSDTVQKQDGTRLYKGAFPSEYMQLIRATVPGFQDSVLLGSKVCEDKEYSDLKPEVKRNLIDPDQLFAQVRNQIAETGKGVFVDMYFDARSGHAHHFCRVTGIENGRVYFENPWGTFMSDRMPPRQRENDDTESMSIADFKQYLAYVTLDKNYMVSDLKNRDISKFLSYDPNATYIYEEEGVISNTARPVEKEIKTTVSLNGSSILSSNDLPSFSSAAKLVEAVIQAKQLGSPAVQWENPWDRRRNKKDELA